jgi:diguanylate cyclase (GGDEF)-like protein/PAS domain S-box-containing protein
MLQLPVLASLALFAVIGILYLGSIRQGRSVTVFDPRKDAKVLYPFYASGATISVDGDEQGPYVAFKTNEDGAAKYNGLVVLGKFSVPPEAALELRWRLKGNATGLDLHVAEASVPASKDRQGEDFLRSVPPPGQVWRTDRFPLRDFTPNSWQEESAIVNGVLESASIGAVQIGLAPGSLVTIDIGYMSLVWKPNVWPALAFLILAAIFASTLALRASAHLRPLAEESFDPSFFVQPRTAFFLLSLALLAVQATDRDIWTSSAAAIFGIAFAWLTVEDFLPGRLLGNGRFAYRYAPLAALIAFSLEAAPFPALISLCLMTLIPPLLVRERAALISLTLVMMGSVPFLPGIRGSTEVMPAMLAVPGIALAAFVSTEYLRHRGSRKELERAMMLYRGVFASSSDAIYTLDTEGRIITVNDAFKTLTGLSGDRAAGRDIRDFLVPEDRAKLSADREGQQDTVNRYGAQLLGPDGSRLDVFVSEHPIIERGRLTGFQVIATDFTERRKLEQELRETNARLEALVHLDELTGVNNRRFFDAQLDIEWRRCHRAHVPLSLIMIDIDHFKLYNDTYGHQGGDACLHRVAQCLQSQLNRAGELLVRYGGEEFVVVLPSADQDAARRVAEHLRRAVAELAIEHRSSPVEPRVTISLGVGTAPVGEASRSKQPQALLAVTDEALYRAKNSGRNRVEVGVLD